VRGAAALVLVAVLGLGGWRGAGDERSARAERPRILFDDFRYRDRGGLRAHGWIVRSTPGWPGVTGAGWTGDNVSFHDRAGRGGDRVLRLTSSTDGTSRGTTQTQLCHARKYREGTYAARVRFRDRPLAGPPGDHVVQAFYAISPFRAPLEPSYSELDFEYLPNGGWGVTEPMLYATTWETFSPEPNWIAVNTSDRLPGSRNGWHTLVAQVAGGAVTYHVDGVRLGTHCGKYYPEVPMSINVNLWFIRDGLLPAGPVRRYAEDVDWVFHQAGAVLSPLDVTAAVTRLRRSGTAFRDTLPAARPPLRSPCDL
jgi:hypothetical protein